MKSIKRLLCPWLGGKVLRSACLFAHVSQKPHAHSSQNFLYMLGLMVAMAQSSSYDSAICYVIPVLCIVHACVYWPTNWRLICSVNTSP